MIAFISGHLDLSLDEFDDHYFPRIRTAWRNGHSFIVGDAKGADKLAQEFLEELGADYYVFHIGSKPRNAPKGCQKMGGFKSDDERDKAMTLRSDYDIAWVRPGREQSGTAKNLARRRKKA